MNNTESNNILTKTQMMKELSILSEWYSPYDPRHNEAYTAYRNHPRELYAQATSVILNNPKAMRVIAPNFYTAFLEYIHNKPEVAEALDKFSQDVSKPLSERLDAIHSEVIKGLVASEKKFTEVREATPTDKYRKKSKWATVKQYILVQLYTTNAKIMALDKEFKLPYDKKVRHVVNSVSYNIGGQQRNYIRDITVNFLKPVHDAGIPFLEMDAYGKYKNILKMKTVVEDKDGNISVEDNYIIGERGITKPSAKLLLGRMEERLGKEMFAEMERLAKVYSKIHLDLMEWAHAEGYWDSSIMKLFRANPHYLKVALTKHIKANIRYTKDKRRGSVEQSISPYTATMYSDMQLIRDVNLGKAKRTMVNKLLKPLAEENSMELEPIKRTMVSKNGKMIPGRIIQKKGWGTLLYRENGKEIGYYVDPYVPLTLENLYPDEIDVISKTWFSLLRGTRAVLTTLNFGFVIANFVFRDFGRSTAAHRSGILPYSILATMYWYLRATPDAFAVTNLYNKIKRVARLRRKPTAKQASQDIIDMGHYGSLDVGKLGLTYDGLQDEGQMTQLFKLVEDMGLEPYGRPTESGIHGIKNLAVDEIEALLDLVNAISTFTEAIPKVAAHKMLKNTGISQEALAELIRTSFGSPNFRELLKQVTGRGALKYVTLFLNPFIRGMEVYIRNAYMKAPLVTKYAPRELSDEDVGLPGALKKLPAGPPPPDGDGGVPPPGGDEGGSEREKIKLPVSSRVQYWSKAIQLAVLGPFTLYLAKRGVFGDDAIRWEAGIPEHNKKRFLIPTIPLFDDNGNSIYITIPPPEEWRIAQGFIYSLVSSITQVSITGHKSSLVGKIFSALTDVISTTLNVYNEGVTVNPSTESSINAILWAKGVPGKETFTKRGIFSADEEALIRTEDSMRIFASPEEKMFDKNKIFHDPFVTFMSWAAAKHGIGKKIYKERRRSTKNLDPRTPLEDLLYKFPALARFIRVGNMTYDEIDGRFKRQQDAVDAAARIDKNRATKRAIRRGDSIRKK